MILFPVTLFDLSFQFVLLNYKYFNFNYFRASATTNDLNFNADGSAINPGAFQEHFKRNTDMMAQLLQVRWYFCSLLSNVFFYSTTIF